jgi:hypothetical protein
MFLRAKQSVAVAIDLLNWLTEQQVVLADVTQAHLASKFHAVPACRCRAVFGVVGGC